MTLRQAKVNALNELAEIARKKGLDAKDKKIGKAYTSIHDELIKKADSMQQSEDRMKEKKAAKV